LRKTGVEKASGFTLIEVLVALAIAALGLAFLVAATGTGLQNATVADQYIQAVGRAQARMAQLGITIPLKTGDYSGDDGGGYRWRVHVGAPSSHAASGNQILNLYPVRTSVSWSSGLLQRTVSFNSERTGPP
jgi:general secretion pathway protein I